MKIYRNITAILFIALMSACDGSSTSRIKVTEMTYDELGTLKQNIVQQLSTSDSQPIFGSDSWFVNKNVDTTLSYTPPVLNWTLDIKRNKDGFAEINGDLVQI